MNLDNELRGTLRTHADDAPSGADMLAGVRVRAHRLEVRRRVGVTGLAAAAVGVAVGAAFALAPVPTSGPPTGVGAPPTTTPPSSAAVSSVALAAPAFAAVTFPLDPTWTPPGLGTPTVGRSAAQVRLIYLGEQTSGLMATAGDELSPADWTPVTTQQVTVRSRPATLTTGTNSEGNPVARITWQLANQQWIDVLGTGLTKAQVKQYADGLDPQPMDPSLLPVVLELAPVGYEIAFQEMHGQPDEFYFCLSPASEVDGDSETWLCLARRDFEPTNGEPVQVGPDPGEIVRADGNVQVIVHRPGFEFAVTENENGPLSEEDLIRYAAGVAAR